MTIELNNIAKRFGPFAALEDVTVRIETGEFLALLGPSVRARRRCCASSPASSCPTRAR